MGTIEKLTLENMGIAFGILSLGGTEPEIHLGVIYPTAIATYVLKILLQHYRANMNFSLRLSSEMFDKTRSSGIAEGPRDALCINLVNGSTDTTQNTLNHKPCELSY